MNIYFDNAATTPMLPEVIEVIHKSMQTTVGNPSSAHSYGRKAKAAVETARKNIAKYFNVRASEIVFTAGGSEADNLILRNAVTHLGVQTIISSAIEHPAVLHYIESLEKEQAAIHHQLSDFEQCKQPGFVAQAKARLAQIETELAQAYTQWEELDQRENIRVRS